LGKYHGFFCVSLLLLVVVVAVVVVAVVVGWREHCFTHKKAEILSKKKRGGGKLTAEVFVLPKSYPQLCFYISPKDLGSILSTLYAQIFF
jgi:hypothetical protein